MEAGKVMYRVLIYTENGTTLNITDAVSGLGWEENDRELAQRISFTMANVKYDNKYLSALIKLGQTVIVKSNMGAGYEEVASGTIKEVERDTTASVESFIVTVYDCLFAMQKSQEDVFYASGKKTKEALKKLFSDWGIQIAEYTGPDISHNKIVYRSQYLSDIVLGILLSAKRMSGIKAIPRAVGNKVSILKVGSNKIVYQLDSTNCIESRYKVSIVSMITRVKIIAAVKDDEPQKVEAIVNGKTEYGILQRIIVNPDSDSLSDSKMTASDMIYDNGDPEKTMTVVAPDVPPIRKGDLVNINAGDMNGDYYVKSIQHNAATAKMSLQVEVFKAAAVIAKIGIHYRVHCQTYGWMTPVSDGAQAGTTGQSKRLEAIKITPPEGVELSVDVHIQTYGWRTYNGVRKGVGSGTGSSSNDPIMGTTGQSKRLEAIRIRCTKNTTGKRIRYQVHIQSIGWQDPVEEGQLAGTTGQSRRLEAIKIWFE